VIGHFTPGVTGGEEQHILSITEIPSHTHSLTGSASAYGVGAYAFVNGGSTMDLIGIGQSDSGNGHNGGGAKGYKKVDLTTSFAVGYTGGTQPHNIMPRFLSLAYIMKL
jgi:microcystin-dependent protein